MYVLNSETFTTGQQQQQQHVVKAFTKDYKTQLQRSHL